MTNNHTPPHPRADADGRTCEYCGEHLEYIGTDNRYNGDYEAEYWCDNCKEYLYYVLPEADHLRARYRDLVHTARTQEEGYELLNAAIRLGRMGYALNDDETDWVLKESTE